MCCRLWIEFDWEQVWVFSSPFRGPLRHTRCVLPVSGFYEWKTLPDGTQQQHSIRRADGQPLYLVGLWDRWEGDAFGPLDSCTILTSPANELKEMLLIAAFLGAFFCTLMSYSTLLLREFDVAYYAFGTALLNAVILAKVILLGEYARLGRKYEGKALMIVALVKALQFALLMALFHIVEEVIKHLLHGHSLVVAVRELTVGKVTVMGAHMLVVFCALVPFFAFRKLQRVFGKEKVFNLFFRSGAGAIGSAK